MEAKSESVGSFQLLEHLAFSLDAALHVLREGRPQLVDRLRVTGAADLERPTGLRGYPVTGTLLATGAGGAEIDAARALIAGVPGLLSGVTLIDDLLVARALARSTQPLQQLFAALWAMLRPRLLGRAAVAPRIWAT